MSQNPSKPPLIKGGYATKSQSSVIKSPPDKGDIGGFETKKNIGELELVSGTINSLIMLK